MKWAAARRVADCPEDPRAEAPLDFRGGGISGGSIGWPTASDEMVAALSPRMLCPLDH
jgi:hypothetical protein